MAKLRFTIPFIGGIMYEMSTEELKQKADVAKKFIADHKKSFIVGSVAAVGVTAALATGRIKTAVAIGVTGVASVTALENKLVQSKIASVGADWDIKKISSKMQEAWKVVDDAMTVTVQVLPMQIYPTKEQIEVAEMLEAAAGI